MSLHFTRPELSRKHRVAITLLLPALIVGAAYFLLFSGQLQVKKRLASETETLGLEVFRMRAMKGSIAAVRKENARLKAELQERMREMPEEREVPGLLRQVSLAAQESKTRVRYFAPRESKPVDFYCEMPFEMKYSGPYHSIGYFFDGIRRLERIVHITSFSLEAREVGQRVVLEGACLAKTYVFMSEAERQKLKEKVKDDKHEPVKK